MAPIKAEYLASEPKVSTACDSTSPGVSENKVWDATSGINGPPKNNLRSKDIAIAMAPAASPPINDRGIEVWPDFWFT